jgi:hypothetical protein
MQQTSFQSRIFPRHLIFLFLPIAYILLADLFRLEYSLAGSLIKTLGFGMFFLLAVTGWGHLVLRFLGVQKEPGEHAVLAFVFGCTLLYATSLVLLVAGLFRPILILILVCAGIVPAISGARFHLTGSQNDKSWTAVERLLLAGIFLIAGVRLVCGLTPLISYDNYVYQFFTPAQYIQHGRFVFIPWNVYTNSPMALQTVLGTSLAFDQSGAVFKLVITLTSLLLCAGAALLAAPAGRTAALLSGLFVLCYPAFWLADTLGTIDLTTAAFTVLGAAWIRTALKNPAGKIYLVASGLAFGFALSSRYQVSVIIVLAIALLLLERIVRSSGQWRTAIKSLLPVAALIVLMLVPWCMKSWIYTGNPVYPLLYEKLGGIDWSSEQANRLSFDVFGAPLSALPLKNQVVAPFRVLFVQPYNGFLGITLLFCAVFAAFFSRSLRFVALIGFVSLICWGLLHPVADVRVFRFNAAGLVFLMAAAGVLVERYGKAGMIASVVIAAASLVFCFESMRAFPVYTTVTQSAYRTNFQHANVPGWNAFDAANRTLDPKKDKVLLIGETRGFALNIPCISPSGFNSPQLLTLFAPLNDPGRWKNNFEKMHISHVVVSLLEWRHLQEKRYYGYINLPIEPQREILHWLQQQKILYEDHSGNVLLQVR